MITRACRVVQDARSSLHARSRRNVKGRLDGVGHTGQPLRIIHPTFISALGQDEEEPGVAWCCVSDKAAAGRIAIRGSILLVRVTLCFAR